MKGQGVQKDLKEAFKWFKQAAEKDNSQSMALVGAIYFFGEWGIEKNSSEAFA